MGGIGEEWMLLHIGVHQTGHPTNHLEQWVPNVWLSPGKFSCIAIIPCAKKREGHVRLIHRVFDPRMEADLIIDVLRKTNHCLREFALAQVGNADPQMWFEHIVIGTEHFLECVDSCLKVTLFDELKTSIDTDCNSCIFEGDKLGLRIDSSTMLRGLDRLVWMIR